MANHSVPSKTYFGGRARAGASAGSEASPLVITPPTPSPVLEPVTEADLEAWRLSPGELLNLWEWLPRAHAKGCFFTTA